MNSNDKQATPTAESTIQQINLTYQKEQDRLLLRVGLSDNSEWLIWLTYRLVRQLWELLQGDRKTVTSHAQTSAPSVQQENLTEAIKLFEQETQIAQTLQKLDFATAYQPRNQHRHHGILLAMQCQIRTLNSQKKLLELICDNELTVNIQLNDELILALCNMLLITSQEAAWDIRAKSTITQTKNATTSHENTPNTLH